MRPSTLSMHAHVLAGCRWLLQQAVLATPKGVRVCGADLHVLEMLRDAFVLLCELAVLVAKLAVCAPILALEVQQHVVLAGHLALLLVDGRSVLCLCRSKQATDAAQWLSGRTAHDWVHARAVRPPAHRAAQLHLHPFPAAPCSYTPASLR